MNPEIRKLGIIAFAAALPLTALAQSSSQPSSSTSSTPSSSSSLDRSSSSTGSTSSNAASRPGNTSGGGSSSSLTSSTPAVSGSSVGNIQRLNDQSLDRQFTAKDLIGKEVYDSGNKRVGEIKDVVLDSTQFQQLANAIRSRESQTSAYGSAALNAGSDTAASSPGVSSSDRNSGHVSSTSSSAVGNTSTGTDYAMSSEPAAIVSSGGLLGVGNNLLRVPLSQLKFDPNSRHLMINVSEQQLSSLQSPSETARSATE